MDAAGRKARLPSACRPFSPRALRQPGVGAARVAELYDLLAAVGDLFDRVMELPFYAPVPGNLGWEERSSRTTS